MDLAFIGARDANSFSAVVRDGGYIPPSSSITYQGVFNQHFHHSGPPEDNHCVALSCASARVCTRREDANDEVWVGCFLKSCHDGLPRDETPIDRVVVLDVSGSMGSQNRLVLAKEALMALLMKLRPDDRFGLSTFTTVGTVIQSLEYVKNLEHIELRARIEALHAGGGTTLEAGMHAAVCICEDATALEQVRHRRLLFLTDMDDLSSDALGEMIAKQAELGLYVSFVGIGMGFNSTFAERVTKQRGCNYFCITRSEELAKVIVDDFDWNFFPVAFDVEVAWQSDHFILAGVYGTPCETTEQIINANWCPDNHAFYPHDVRERAKELLLCSLRSLPHGLPLPAMQQTMNCLSPEIKTIIRCDTVFPSAVRLDGSVEGGLILLRLKPRKASTFGGNIKLMLRYFDNNAGVEVARCTDLKIPGTNIPDGDPAVVKGVKLQQYVEASRRFLVAVERGSALVDLKVALDSIQELMKEFDAAPEEMDKTCLVVRQELMNFSLLAHNFVKGVVPMSSQPSADGA